MNVTLFRSRDAFEAGAVVDALLGVGIVLRPSGRAKIADRIGKSTSYVRDRLKLRR